MHSERTGVLLVQIRRSIIESWRGTMPN
uniref:Uncharacterized protein n=1 Tax=Anguilla anguilla TaxID=7936 RepID=A0A0E9QRM9_ANGAN